jgi:hypothetical protein
MTNELEGLRAARPRSAQALAGRGRPRRSPRPEQVAEHARDRQFPAGQSFERLSPTARAYVRDQSFDDGIRP